jgi:LEA14-like dessication related protein
LFYTSGTGAFTASQPGYEGNNAAKISVGSAGSNIQFYQTGVILEPDTRYRLSFAAYSTTGHDVTVELFQHDSPYTAYMPDFTVNLETTWQTFTTDFISSGFSSPVNDGRLMFWLAQYAAAGDTYYIDDIRLEKILPPAITTHPSAQTVSVGQTASFSVVATGSAPLSYQWQKNDVNISGATDSLYTTHTTIVPDSGSEYRVLVMNSEGSTTSIAATLTITPTDSINLIMNPGFESKTTSWLFYTNGTGAFTASQPGYEGNNAAKLVFGSAGSNIQFYQTGVILEPDTRYRLSFAAYSTTGHDVTVELFQHDSPYTAYMPDFTVNLETTWQTFTTEFISGVSSPVNDGRLMFWLAPFAKAGDTYYIDNVILERV